MSKSTPRRKLSMWTGPKRRATGVENIPARPDGGPPSERPGFARGAKVGKT